MKNLKLLVVAALLVAIAILVENSSKPTVTTDPLAGKNLLEATEIDQVREIALTSDQGKIQLKFADNAWRLPDYANMQADRNKVEDLFQRLNNTKIIELVSSNVQRHKDLGVASIAADALPEGQEALNIVMKNDQGTDIKNLVLGKGRQARVIDGGQGWGSDGQYCRMASSAAVYLLNNLFYAEKNLKNWLSKELLKLEAATISKISWSGSDKNTQRFSLERTCATDSLVLSDLAADKQTVAINAASAANFFAMLMFEDIIATTAPELYPDLKEHTALTVDTFSGLQVNMKISSAAVELPGQAKSHIFLLTANYEGTDTELKKIAAELNHNGSKAVYTMGEERFKPVLITVADLSEDKPAPQPETESATAAPAAENTVSASHILLAYEGADRSSATRSDEEAKKLADELLKKINAGEDFDKLAEENSDCPSGKSAKGSLGEFGRGAMAKEFEEGAFALKVGEISPVIKTAFGYHIIRRDK